MNLRNEFEKWFDEYFLDTQGEDSPYSYFDIKEAFRAGWKIAKFQKEK